MPFPPIKTKGVKIGQNTLYSGYPNDEAMYTIKGYVSGINYEGNYYIHSYAWRGASGSSVGGVPTGASGSSGDGSCSGS